MVKPINLSARDQAMAKLVAAEIARQLAPLVEPLIQAAHTQSRALNVKWLQPDDGQPGYWAIT